MSLLSFSTIYGFDGVAEVRFRSLIRQKCCGRIRPVSARIRRFEARAKRHSPYSERMACSGITAKIDKLSIAASSKWICTSELSANCRKRRAGVAVDHRPLWPISAD
jgi:hypothetical protein